MRTEPKSFSNFKKASFSELLVSKIKQISIFRGNQDRMLNDFKSTAKIPECI